MKYEEYEARMNHIVANPDSAVTEVLDILKEIKTDTDTIASLEAGVADRDSRIKDLQDRNIKLFMRLTGGTDTQEPEEKDPDQVLDELFKED